MTDERATTDARYDVAIVGAGPAGASCAYWLARAGWRVCLIEKKHLPREKTCGDGLTPRAVRQIQDMGLEAAVAATGHRYDGLRAFGFGGEVDMPWPATAAFPTYGYTITRHDLDVLVADHAASAGATLWTHTEAEAPLQPTGGGDEALPWVAGVRVHDAQSGERRDVLARFVVVADGHLSRFGRILGARRNRQWPLGMALRGYYRSDRSAEPWIDSHLDLRDPRGEVVPGYGWVFPLGDGRINLGVGLLSTEGAWKGVNTTRLLGYFEDQVADAWGLTPAARCGPPTGGKLPMGLSVGPRTGPNTVVIGDAAGSINPFNGEGIAYGYESGRLAAAHLSRALAAGDPAWSAAYERDLDAAYGDYYSVARAFVRFMSHPEALRRCVALGMRVPPVMRGLLPIMSNLMRNEGGGVPEFAYRAMVKVAAALPPPAAVS